jgi:hypothetical protein
MNTVVTTSSSDQVKIATLLFLTLFYTEHRAHSPLPNGNKLTTPDFVRPISQAKSATNQLCSQYYSFICVVNFVKTETSCITLPNCKKLLPVVFRRHIGAFFCTIALIWCMK